ncbi:MAG: capsular polysaccharide biosynthesis protein CapF, partial [Eubacterium sp.]|nr:capsular polysaccharide biosynthesis protein CapF [Eubacterium sp.]
DLVTEMLDAMEGREHRLGYQTAVAAGGTKGTSVVSDISDGMTPVPDKEGRYCFVPVTHHVTLGEIVEDLQLFKSMPQTLVMPAISDGTFIKKLYSTYLSYLPSSAMTYDLRSNIDERGSFTELLRTNSHGQVSVNITKPGVTKGEHWHNSKWEIFVVVSGRGLIRERRIGIDPTTGCEYPVTEFEVSGDHIQAVQMLPGYTHSITNLSDDEDLITVMWANEHFDESHPDTFREPV